MSTPKSITRDRLKECLEYLPDTGDFIWRAKLSRNTAIGEKAGCLDSTGYVLIRIDKKLYKAHRLAFLYMGVSVPTYVDHINGNPSDNRWCNLRAASPSENGHNRSVSTRNKSGVKGVSWDKSKGSWLAQVGVNGRNFRVGTYTDLISAEKAVREARERLHGGFYNHG